MSPLQHTKLREQVQELRELFNGNLDGHGNGNQLLDLLDQILDEEYPTIQLNKLMSLNRFLCSCTARWGASGSPVLSTDIKGGALVGMYVCGYPDCAKTAADFLVEQAVKIPKFTLDPSTPPPAAENEGEIYEDP